MIKTGCIWLAFSFAVLLALSRSSATCAEGGDEANRQPNADDLVRAILTGDDQQLLTVAAWFRVMRPEDVAAALRRLQDTLKVELLKARGPTGSASVSVRGTVVGEAGQLMHGKVCLKRIVTGSPRGAAREVLTELVRAGAVRVVDSDGDFEFAGVDRGTTP